MFEKVLLVAPPLKRSERRRIDVLERTQQRFSYRMPEHTEMQITESFTCGHVRQLTYEVS